MSKKDVREFSKKLSNRLRRAEGEGDGIDEMVGLGLLSDYQWRGEDLADALRRLADYS